MIKDILVVSEGRPSRVTPTRRFPNFVRFSIPIWSFSDFGYLHAKVRKNSGIIARVKGKIEMPTSLYRGNDTFLWFKFQWHVWIESFGDRESVGLDFVCFFSLTRTRCGPVSEVQAGVAEIEPDVLVMDDTIILLVPRKVDGAVGILSLAMSRVDTWKGFFQPTLLALYRRYINRANSFPFTLFIQPSSTYYSISW